MALTENTKLKRQLQDLLKFGEDPEATLLEKLDELDKKLAQFKKLADDLKGLDLRPGKDANPNDVVALVLAKIKTPPLETAQQTVEKINKLPLVDDQKIDADHIRNLPKGGAVVTRVANPIAIFDEDTVLTDYVKELKFSGAGVQATLVNGQVVVTISGGGAANESNGEELINTGDDLNFTFAHTPTVGGVRNVWKKETGQLLTPTTDYTVSGNTLTATSSQAGFTLISNYTY